MSTHISRLPMWISETPLDFPRLFSLPAIECSKDWDQVILPHPVRFWFAADPTRLYFGGYAAGTAPTAASHRPGEFIEGLWEHDVMELFLCDDHSDAYQEFNLAPNGAWWSAAFKSYRSRMESKSRPQSVETFAGADSGGWRTALSIARSELAISCGLSPASRANCAAILGTPERRYISTMHAGPGLRTSTGHPSTSL